MYWFVFEGVADKNGDGQIDVKWCFVNMFAIALLLIVCLYASQYEEFLRMLHPEFHDEDMTMDNFKHNIVDVDSGRVKGAQFDVDYSMADSNNYKVVASSPSSPTSRHGASPSMRNALGLDAFKQKSLSQGLSAEEAENIKALYEQRINQLEQQLAAKDARIVELEAEVERLQK